MQTNETAQTTPTPPASSFGLTDSAAKRINLLKTKDGRPDLRFRVTVKGGGCSGFQYEFNLDASAPVEGDVLFTNNGAEVIVDDVSLGLLAGGILDYTEDLSHAGFEIKNPNATARCGCGNSFSVAL
jgi:iron-sulfur cluster insertion protein